jgi:acetyl esterase/lipase
MKRRELLRILATAGAACILPGKAVRAEAVAEMRLETFVYKSVGDCRIKADVYRSTAGAAPRPVIMTIHGGALIMGGRYPIQFDLFEPLIRSGVVVVSIDYRLAPETKLPEIVKDVQDAYAWIREKGPKLFDADPERIAVQGDSAGGYLTLMTGFCVKPAPKALVSYYGYGDIISDWYSRPDPFYCLDPPVSKEAAYGAVGEKVLSCEPPGSRRNDFYLYCRQQGLWPKEVAGFDPSSAPERFKPYCPVQNVGSAYPPTLLAHGDQDTDVPYAQSVLMDAALQRVGVKHEFVTLRGGGHGFAHVADAEYLDVLERTRAFLQRYLLQKP